MHKDMSETDSINRVSVVIDLLKRCDKAGLKFEEAKASLLKQGYTESEISLAAGNYQYGLPQPISDVPHKTAEYFKAHPDQALADGENLLKAQHKEDVADERTQAILDITASEGAGELGVGNTDAQVEYESKFAADIGVSFWLLFFGGIAVNAVVFLLVK